jgi:hypothetical protein
MGICVLSMVKTTGWWSDVCGISDLTWVLVGNTVSEMSRFCELGNSQSSTLLHRVPSVTFEWCVSYEYSHGQLRVVITTRRLSVASFAIDHPSLGRNNNKWCVSYEYSHGWRVSQRSVGLSSSVVSHYRVRLSLAVSLCVGLSVVIHAALRSPPSSTWVLLASCYYLSMTR